MRPPVPTGPPCAPLDGPLLYRLVLTGREPAEALTTSDREHLVVELIDAGWSIAEIATRCRMTPYTTDRIARRVFGDDLAAVLGRAQDRVAAHAQTTLDRLAQRDRETRRSA